MLAFMQFAQVAYVRLGREGRVGLAAQIIGADPEQFVGFVDAAVEQHVVIRHVQMTVVVDPARLHPHHGGDEWRKEQRFEVATVEHS